MPIRLKEPRSANLSPAPTTDSADQTSNRSVECASKRSLWRHASAGSLAPTSLRRLGYFGFLPRRIRIERRDLLRDFVGVRPEVFLEYGAGVADDKGHHAGVTVLGRIGDERKAADHLAVDDVIGDAAGRMPALFGQDLVVVAVIGGAACFSAYLYRARNLGERLFNKTKQCRQVATRFDKLAAN
jgi:hypothetical protein